MNKNKLDFEPGWFNRGGAWVSGLKRYGLALILTSISILLRLGLAPVFQHSMPFAFCSVAIAFSAALGGLGPGLLATVLSALITDYWFIEPRGSLDLTSPHVIGEVVTLLVIGGLLCLVIEALRRAWRRERRQQAEFRALFERTAIGSAQIDLASERFLRVNRKFAQIAGYREPELLGMTFLHLLYPEDREPFLEGCARLLRGEIAECGMEVRFVHGGDGRLIWVETLGTLAHTPGGQPLYAIASVQEITRRKLAEDAVRESEARYRQVIHAAGSVIIGVDIAGRITMYNGYAEQLFGYSAHEVLGQHVIGSIVPVHDLDGREMQPVIAELIRHADQYSYHENENQTKDGRRLWMAWTNRPILEADGTMRELICVGLDLTARKRTEDALLQSEERFRAAFEHAPLGITQIGPDGRLLEVNDALCRMLGYAREELRGKTFVEITHPDDREADNKVLRGLLAGETASIQVEKRYLRRDGEPVWVRVTSALTHPPQSHRIAIVEDISARMRADTLQRERTFLRQVLDATPSMIFVKDREGRFVLANEALAHAYGTTVEGVVGRTDADFNPHREELDHFRRNDLDVMDSRQEKMIPEEQVTFANGEVHWFSTIKVPLLNEDGSCDRMLGVASDITARKEAEEALRRSEEQYRTLMETIPQMVWTIRPDGVHDFCNHTWHDYTGLNLEATTNFGWARALHPEDAPGAVAAWSQAFASGQPLEAESRLRRAADGAYRWHYTRIVPIRGADGRIVQWIGTAMDIHELHAAREALQAANEQLAEADRHKDEFLAMLAHELRNPLAPIRNAVQILNNFCYDSCANSERLQRQRCIIERQVSHMARLLDDLLDVSRVTRGRIDLQKHPLRLTDVLAHAVETAGPLVEARRQTLHVAWPSEDLHVEGDIDRLAQVVGNLLTNAAKYTDAGGQIWLEAAEEAGDAVVRVRDNGVGIAPEMLERVFELFTQADQSLGRSRGGLGIGLTMVRKLVELHGGRVEARSAGLGQGSEFIVRLPALAAGAGELVAESVPASGLPSGSGEFHSRRILVVDDVADTAESLAELLESWGHDVRTAHSGPEGLQAASAFRPDVVLLDIGMPGMDGYEVARSMRCMLELEGVQLIALTGYGQEQDREASRQAGFNHHLVKPVNLATLREMLAYSVA